MAAGREHLRSRVGRVAVVLAVFFWLAGGFTVDLLWWTERTNRGVGPAWHVPLLSGALAAVGYLFILVGPLVQMCLQLPEALFNAGSTIQTAWLLLLAISLAWCLRSLTQNRVWLESMALAASTIFLGYKAVEWGLFIGD